MCEEISIARRKKHHNSMRIPPHNSLQPTSRVTKKGSSKNATQKVGCGNLSHKGTTRILFLANPLKIRVPHLIFVLPRIRSHRLVDSTLILHRRFSPCKVPLKFNYKMLIHLFKNIIGSLKFSINRPV